MTTEEKELLLKDLCARLPYGVIMNYKDYPNDYHTWKLSTLNALPYSKAGIPIDTDWDGDVEYVEYPGCGMSTASRPISLEKNLPYLRPMSSMTEEEESIYEQLTKDVHYKPRESTCCKLISWLNEHHFDYNYLIGKGLALEAPEDMYKEN